MFVNEQRKKNRFLRAIKKFPCICDSQHEDSMTAATASTGSWKATLYCIIMAYMQNEKLVRPFAVTIFIPFSFITFSHITRCRRHLRCGTSIFSILWQWFLFFGNISVTNPIHCNISGQANERNEIRGNYKIWSFIFVQSLQLLICFEYPELLHICPFMHVKYTPDSR